MKIRMPLPEPHITPDSFFHETTIPTRTPASSQATHYPTTIYFITGNPGLISYYHAFLSSLGQKLSALPGDGSPNSESEKGGKNSVHILGHSLAGFELESSTRSKKDGIGNVDGDGDHYFSLEEQICFVQRRLSGHMADLWKTSTSSMTKSRPKVILIGHSVGTYMAMEILRRHRETRSEKSEQQNFDIVGGILLFPTVKDIAASPSGKKLTFLLRLIPQLALVVSIFVRILVTLLPASILSAVVNFVMKGPPREAAHATCEFLRSKRGVRQALHMAADEMRTITSDKWSDDVWGVSETTESELAPPAQLFFYFGRNDHWVAERTREEIITSRGSANEKEGEGPRMVVCEEAVPHAFCLRHSEIMAGKTADMIREILS
ncbi:hypothetical protein BJX68DRAFT_66501 [Aspergillus pseudodeflectus]|uniref:Lipid droplet-associated hydrolase n=1 Tax=Aspergillus pseudodeflectus TaxID=176178 RepID=A0ABR4KHL0_9EURO